MAGRQLAENARPASAQKNPHSTSPLARAHYGAAEAGSSSTTPQQSRNNSKTRRPNGHASPSTPAASSSNAEKRNESLDHDVPNWELDGRRRMSSGSSHQSHNASTSMTAASSSSTAPSSAPSQDSRDRRSTSAEYHGGRPLLTQLTDDVDGLNHQHEPDQEVDGDGTGYVLGGGAGGASSDTDAVPVQSQLKADYSFPRHRLPLKMRDESKIPLVIVACGSFSPPTYLHLRIFEMAKDQVIESGKYELLAGYYSPVSDHYRKAGLAQARHRVRMCELAVEKTSTWLMVDAWESLQDEYQRTAVVLDHFENEINGPLAPPAAPPPSSAHAANGSSEHTEPRQPERGVLMSDGRRRRVKIMLLAGGDLIQSMGEPGVWADADLHHILGRYGCMIVERTGADVWSFLLSHDLLWRYRRNLRVVKQTIYNDISSSKVRLFVRRGQSIKYLLPNSVIKYIETHQLYRLDAAAQHSQQPKGEDGEPYVAPEDEHWA